MKRILSVFLCVLMTVSVLSVTDITGSAAYENTHANTGNQIEDLIAVATTQIGYCEGNSASQLGGTVAGSGNYTKFGQWYGINPGAWCAMFVSWCANQAGIPSSVIPKHASCDIGMNWFKNKGLWHNSRYFGGTYTPVRGDIIYFGDNPNNPNDSTHVGIVTGVDSTKVYTVEGNKSNKCKTYSYALTGSYIFGYGTPAYTSQTSTYQTGKYVITASNLNMRSTPSTSGTVLAVLTSGTYVDVTETSGKWGKITYGTHTGWVSLAYASPVEAIRYNVSDNGIAFLKSIEGYRSHAYWDVSQWSIGYGTGCGENEYPNGITEPEAELLLRSAVVKYEIWLNSFLYSNKIELNQNQYDALVSFTYNLGNIWSTSFTLRTYLLNGIQNYTDAQITAAFGEKVYAGGSVNQGLVNRRNKEAALFLKQEEQEIETYTVSFDPNGGTLTGGNASYKMSVGEYYCDVIGTAPTATKSGYTFGGWYCEKYDYTLSLAAGEYFAAGENVTFKAQWISDTAKYTVSYNANGGSGAPASQTKTKGANLTLTTAVPTRNGYVFAGWATSPNGAVAYSVADTYKTDASTTLYAVWCANPAGGVRSFIITADSLNIRNLATTSGSTVLASVPKGTLINATQYYQNGAIVPSVTTYESGTWGYVTYGNVTGWMSLSPSYSSEAFGIFYNLTNGGNGTISNQIKTKGDAFTLDSTVPVRAGYTFAGWSVDPNATVPTYKAGAVYEANEYGFLYDIWQEIHVHNYTGAITLQATCTSDGVRTYTCSCGDSYTVTITATGHSYSSSVTLPSCTQQGYTLHTCANCGASYTDNTVAALGHSFGEWTEVISATATTDGLRRRECVRCDEYEEEVIPATGETPASGVDVSVNNYIITFTNAANINTIRIASGDLTTSGEIKNAPDCITINKAVITAGTDGNGNYNYELPDAGIWSVWYKTNGGQQFIVSGLDNTVMTQSVDTYGVTMAVNNLCGVKDFFVAKGHYDTYRGVKNAEGSFGVTSAKFGSAHSYKYGAAVGDPGEYTICIRYNDTSRPDAFLYFNCEVEYPTVDVFGKNITIGNIDDIRVIRVAPGTYSTSNAVKNAEGCRNFTSSAIAGLANADGSLTVNNAAKEDGSDNYYTVSIEYKNLYTEIHNITVNKLMPEYTVSGGSITFTALAGLDILRYASGTYTTANGIKNAPGAQYVKGANVQNGTVTLTGLSGTYSFLVQYTENSKNIFTVEF